VRFGARDYDASTGRWVAKDSTRFGGGDTNLYNYSRSDPINFVDETGRVAHIVGGIAGGALGGAAIGAIAGGVRAALRGEDLGGIASGAAAGAGIGAATGAVIGGLAASGIGAGALAGARLYGTAGAFNFGFDTALAAIGPPGAIGAFIGIALVPYPAGGNEAEACSPGSVAAASDRAR
jgi:hypothetical protein